MRLMDALSFAVLLVPCADAEPADAAAENAFERGRFADALRLVKPVAQRGSANAQALMARLYYNGLGGPQRSPCGQTMGHQGDTRA
jgi:TPR repeat protein